MVNRKLLMAAGGLLPDLSLLQNNQGYPSSVSMLKATIGHWNSCSFSWQHVMATNIGAVATASESCVWHLRVSYRGAQTTDLLPLFPAPLLLGPPLVVKIKR